MKSRTEQVYHQLKERLLNCAYEAGGKIHIERVAQDLEVSPGAVREALSRLTSDGLVEAQAQRGFIVTPMSEADLIDLTRTRIEIETLCLRRSIALGGLDWEADLVAAWHALRSLEAVDDEGLVTPDWPRRHDRFHNALVAGCDYIWWMRLRQNLFDMAERYRRRKYVDTRDQRNLRSEHQEIFEATLARDADRASACLADHLATTTRLLLSVGI